jgi:(1->4)-alpha-D-glucan 1-alpha-D-glucosylmutase
VAPDEAYEAACKDFLFAILDPSRSSRLWEELAAFAARIGPAGAVNGLTQTVLRLTVPGVPDLYQGTDLWDGSLVDPDNRRPVDYALRRDMLGTRKAPVQLVRDWQSGQIKQAVIGRVLALRRRLPGLFGGGSYQPLTVEGPGAENVIAFARQDGEAAVVTVATLRSAGLLQARDVPVVPAAAWGDTAVVLPAHLAASSFANVLDDAQVAAKDGRLDVATLLGALPVAVLTR